MAGKSKIEWTERTWNPIRGCTRVSEGCRNCYAERMAARFSGEGRPYEGLAVITASGPRWTNEIMLVESDLEKPLRWRKSSMVFVNSMSDLFHENVPLDYIQRIFNVMARANQQTFQILTKRSTRLLELSPVLLWADNIWMGVSVENQEVMHRVDDLRGTGACVKFLSLEPLIGRLPFLDLAGIGAGLLGCMEGIRLLAHNAVIDKILIRGWANLKEASLYLGRSDTFLRRYLDQPGDGNPDPAKLNGKKGQKDWTFAVTELDRFNKDVLRASVPTVDSGGVEIRNSQLANRRSR